MTCDDIGGRFRYIGTIICQCSSHFAGSFAAKSLALALRYEFRRWAFAAFDKGTLHGFDDRHDNVLVKDF